MDGMDRMLRGELETLLEMRADFMAELSRGERSAIDAMRAKYLDRLDGAIAWRRGYLGMGTVSHV